MPANQVNPNQTSKPEPEIDEELANGPLGKRSCRDVLCCLLFIAFIGGMIGIGAYGYTKGRPTLIGRGYDADGNMCGITAGYEDYPYLYFPIPFPEYAERTICVKSCPSSDPLPTVTECKPVAYFGNSCTAYSTNYEAMVAEYAINKQNLANRIYVYPSSGYVSRYCLPKLVNLTAISDTILNKNNSETLEQWISDIKETWPVIAVSVAVAFVIGFVYMVLLRYCSGVLTWAAILAFIAGLAVLGWRFYKNADDYEANVANGNNSDSGSNTTKTITSERVIAYVCWGIAAFTFLAVLCLFNRIRLAIAILKAAADYVKDTPSVFLVPPITVVILLIFYAFWSGAAVFLVSSGEAYRISGTPFASFSFDTTLKRLLIYHLFGLLWINAFIIAATQFILASSTAIWYFSQGTGQNVPGTIRTSVKRLFRYHFGSIAFGSLILAIIQLIRIILAYMEYQAKKMQGNQENKFLKYTLRCLQCYVACFERFIKFLNKNAYIQIALTGKNFCAAAKDAFFLIVNNPLRMGVVTGIGSVFVLFGKVFIACITALIAFLVITNWDKYSENVHSPFIPTLVVFIFAYAVGAVFMTIYGLAADTILACFIIDEQMNKKKNAPPRHCPESLKSFLDNNRKK